ncbi:SGL domain-containing protein [Mycena sanguinolenta]|uniref:SGL domain-containing protein n=1 Tax=Mycena sanguinolenta TaxID=230812 RepID=A0A8H6Z1L3_9AGAR|nr:SGL domain-containing protein [Mycena sanguinolenta]
MKASTFILLLFKGALVIGQAPIVRENKLAFAVLDPLGPFRNGSQLFEPTPNVNLTPPYFQVYDERFDEILGPNPSVRVIVQNDSFAFAHDGPVWVNETNEIFVTGGRTLGRPVSVINLNDLQTSPTGLINFTILPLGPDVQINNGGTLFRGDLLLVTTGSGPLPPSLIRVNPKPPFNDTIILNNFYGRQFNSLNDAKVHPQSRAIFFTDETYAPPVSLSVALKLTLACTPFSYGFENGFRPAPLIPNQVYRFDADSGEVRVVADGFSQPNGIAFSPDGNTAYIADSGETQGVNGGIQPTLPATIYAFDVVPDTQAFANRRVFAFIDSDVPDGLTLDTNGNLYVGCGDGTEVFDSKGTLLGKIFLGVSSSNMIFAGPNRLVIMADTKVFLAEIAAEGVDLNL